MVLDGCRCQDREGKHEFAACRIKELLLIQIIFCRLYHFLQNFVVSMNFVCFVVLHFRTGYVYVYLVDFDEQPSKLKFFISGQLETNSLGLVIKGLF